MANPWGKKNPFMSMWLSAANASIGATRARLASQSRRSARSVAAAGANAWLELLTGTPAARRAKRRKK